MSELAGRQFSRRSFVRGSGMLVAGLSLAGTELGGDALAALVRARGYGGPPTLTIARNLSRDPDVVEVELVARETTVQLGPGEHARLWTYNDVVPGPLIEAKTGDTLIVHLVNELPQPTTIHWHGVEVPAAMDGSNIAQPPVPPGETFRYEFKLLTPALYWYHPHISSNEQVERGLAGALVVYDPDEDRRLGREELAYSPDQVLVLDDVLLTEGDGIRTVAPFSTDPNAPLTPVARAAEQLNGREGNVLIVKGREQPTLRLHAGVPQRWRIVNVANARFMRLSIAGHTIHRIGGDGGLLEQPLALPPIEMVHDHHTGQMVSDPDPGRGLLLVPGERADVVFTPNGHPGDELVVQWHDFPRGRHHTFPAPDGGVGFEHAHDDGARPPLDLLRIRLTGTPGGPADGDYVPPSPLRTIERLDPAGAPKLPVPFGHTAPGADGNITFFNATRMVMTPGGMVMMGIPFGALTPGDAADVVVGGTYVWEAVNLSGGDHPFHPHGFFFQPFELEYVDMDEPANNRVVPIAVLENKDTIRIPKRPGAMGRSRTILRGVVRFDDAGREGLVAAEGKEPSPGQSGGWLAHCHILEHADRGMMTFYELRYPAE